MSRRIVAIALTVALVLPLMTTPVRAQPAPELTLYQAQALWAINCVRLQLGLEPLRSSPALQMAAQAHAQFAARNYQDYEQVNWHYEPATWRDRPGWTGERSWDRAQAFGYTSRAVSEVMHSVSSAPAAVEGWLNSIWHRFPLIDPDARDLGFGLATTSAGDTRIVANIGYLSTASNAYPIRYPFPGQTRVPLKFNGELPDPLEGTGVQEGGYPITLTFDPREVVTAVIGSASLVEMGAGEVPIVLYDDEKWKSRDPIYGYVRMANSVALIARAPLKPGQTYRVRITGTLRLVDGGTRPFDESWSFSTVPIPDKVTWVVGTWRFASYQSGMRLLYKSDSSPQRWVYVGPFIAVKSSNPANQRVLLRDGTVAQEIPVPLRDLDRTPWAVLAAYALWSNGWMQGRGAGLFDPTGKITEAEAAVVLHRIAGEPQVQGNTPHGSPEWAKQALTWAAAVLARGEEIVPGQPITRSKLVAWTVRTLVPDTQFADRAPGFVDDGAVPSEHRAELAWARTVGLAQGKPGGTFDPQSPVTRAEAAVLLCRAFVGGICEEQ